MASRIEHLFENVTEATRLLKEALDDLDPRGSWRVPSRPLVESFAAVERLAAAGKALTARRVAASRVWRTSGEKSAAPLDRKGGGQLGRDAGDFLESLCDDLDAPAKALSSFLDR